jgi:glycosyltransferase involved in cell wall biosynthesis
MVNVPILTIITPVYNGEKFIKETIESVLKANIDVNYEYIVLDDGSTDATGKILNEFKNLIKIFSHDNIGEPATINRGLNYAIGKYILVVNADDPFLSSKLLTEAVRILNQDSSIAAVYPDWKIIDETGVLVQNKILPEYSDAVMIGHCKCLPGPGTIFRKDFATEIGGRNSKWKYVSDYDFWLRLSRVGRIVRLPGILAQWRENSSSTSVSQKGIKMAEERIEVIKNFIQQNSIPDSLKRMALGNSYYLAARLAFFDPQIKGKTLFIKAIMLRRRWPEEAKFYIFIYIFLMPISSLLINSFRNTIIKKISYR